MEIADSRSPNPEPDVSDPSHRNCANEPKPRRVVHTLSIEIDRTKPSEEWEE